MCNDDRSLLSAEVLRDEIVCCPALLVSALLVLVAGGTRAAKLSEICGRKICGVLSSVCLVPHSVRYICKSVETWQADALIVVRRSRVLVCGEDWLRSPGSVMSVVALGNDISRRSDALSALIVDS